MNHSEWLLSIKDDVGEFLEVLRVPSQPGRFLPCVKGATKEGTQLSLGFSCFALKIYYTLGLWDTLTAHERESWIAFLKSFQIEETHGAEALSSNAFIDRPLITSLIRQIPWYQRVIARVLRPPHLTYLQRVINAETKQAIATLIQVGESLDRPYGGFPITENGIRNYLTRLDWTQPWAAGAQLSALAVFLTSQAPRFLPAEETQQLLKICNSFTDTLVDRGTGAYFKGSLPEHGVLVNGAMKILNALEWLGMPIHCPERLIDTCLAQLPSSDSCHLVDVIYVIYRCVQQTTYRMAEVDAYCTQVLEKIVQHRNLDGGFSYHIGRSQRYYYGVLISHGYAESDIHGTCLLTWAIAMILNLRDEKTIRLRVIKP